MWLGQRTMAACAAQGLLTSIVKGPSWSKLIISMLCILILLVGFSKFITPTQISARICEKALPNHKIHNNVTSNSEVLEGERVKILAELWGRALDQTLTKVNPHSVLPRAPHIQDCDKCFSEFTKSDSRDKTGKRPRWSLWKGSLGGNLPVEDEGEEMLLDTKALIQGPYPPWIHGGDEDNLPLTRRAQRDIWLHQHPPNCSNAKFLLADWRTSLYPKRSVGVGAEILDMTGLLAIALKQGRVLVTKDYHGANHTGCVGADHFRWSCYFAPEASTECIDRALQLASQTSAWKSGLITGNKDYPSNVGLTVPKIWGKPWKFMQKTVELNGGLIADYNAEDRRWWRSQGFRYLMRFPSKYLCNLLNHARHDAFGVKAAETVVNSLPLLWPKVPFVVQKQTAIEKLVWSSFGPWIPRPLISVHVRQGDKGWEMKIYAFKDYMKLVSHLRRAFPHVRDVWLSTEMQNVVEESRDYIDWNFYFTNISRQTGSKSMAKYMTELGNMRNFDNAFVNLWMAAESDFFVGTLGSTWSYVIDGLRMTNGKVMSGFLTVNSINKLL